MKKFLLFATTLITFSAKSQTSQYYPFPEDSATWCASMCGNQGNSLNEATYQLNGKVFINGNWYSRMLHYERNCYGVGSCYCGLIYGADTTTYYIRQDTTQKKVWIYIPSTNSDTIFLDFNLNIGDTIDGRKEYWAQPLGFGEYAFVSSIDSVLIGSQYRKRYNYTYQAFMNSMIEGIGPTHGPFYLENIGYDHIQTLNIFSQNNQLFYPYYSSDTTGMWQSCHDFTTTVKESELENNISIYPNPATNNFTLRLDSEIKNAKLEVYDAIGVKVYQQKLNQRSTTIHQTFFSGIYFVKVTDGERTFAQKLIIQ